MSDLTLEVGYWKSMHARAVERNEKLQTELNDLKAEVRQLKAGRFGKQSEKQSSTDRRSKCRANMNGGAFVVADGAN